MEEQQASLPAFGRRGGSCCGGDEPFVQIKRTK